MSCGGPEEEEDYPGFHYPSTLTRIHPVDVLVCRMDSDLADLATKFATLDNQAKMEHYSTGDRG